MKSEYQFESNSIQKFNAEAVYFRLLLQLVLYFSSLSSNTFSFCYTSSSTFSSTSS